MTHERRAIRGRFPLVAAQVVIAAVLLARGMEEAMTPWDGRSLSDVKRALAGLIESADAAHTDFVFVPDLLDALGYKVADYAGAATDLRYSADHPETTWRPPTDHRVGRTMTELERKYLAAHDHIDLLEKALRRIYEWSVDGTLGPEVFKRAARAEAREALNPVAKTFRKGEDFVFVPPDQVDILTDGDVTGKPMTPVTSTCDYLVTALEEAEEWIDRPAYRRLTLEAWQKGKAKP